MADPLLTLKLNIHYQIVLHALSVLQALVFTCSLLCYSAVIATTPVLVHALSPQKLLSAFVQHYITAYGLNLLAQIIVVIPIPQYGVVLGGGQCGEQQSYGRVDPPGEALEFVHGVGQQQRVHPDAPVRGAEGRRTPRHQLPDGVGVHLTRLKFKYQLHETYSKSEL